MTSAQLRGAVAVLSALLALGCAALAIAHSGVAVPVLSTIGPGGDRAVPIAAGFFTVGAVLLAAIAIGARRERSWAWALGVVVHALVLFGAAVPYRGVASLVAIVVSAIALALLLSRQGRAALLARGALSALQLARGRFRETRVWMNTLDLSHPSGRVR